MRSVKLVLLLACLYSTAYAASCSSTSLGNSLTCIVSDFGISSGAGTGATTSSHNTTGGNFGVAIVTSYQAGTAVTMSDARTGCASPCNTWTKLTGTSVCVTADNCLDMYYSQNMTVGAGHTFSCSGTTTYCSLAVAVIGTLATTSVFDTGTDKNNSVTAQGTTNQVGSITPTSGVRLIVSGLGPELYSGATPTVDSGMTVYEFSTGSSGQHWAVALALKSQATGTAINPTWTFDLQSNTNTNIAAFKTTSAG